MMTIFGYTSMTKASENTPILYSITSNFSFFVAPFLMILCTYFMWKKAGPPESLGNLWWGVAPIGIFLFSFALMAWVAK